MPEGRTPYSLMPLMYEDANLLERRESEWRMRVKGFSLIRKALSDSATKAHRHSYSFGPVGTGTIPSCSIKNLAASSIQDWICRYGRWKIEDIAKSCSVVSES